VVAALHSSDLQRHVGRYYGKYSGEVVEVNDDLKLGRIKVTIPSVFPPGMSVWARPCFPSGHFFVPPPGTRVWIEFEAGHTSYPLWVGTWYPQGTVPPEAGKPEATGKVVHTPSGHLIELSDEQGKEKIVVRHKGNAFVSIDKDGSVLAATATGSFLFLNAAKGEVTMTSEQGHLVTLNDKGIAAVEKGGSRIEILDGKVKITGTTAVQVVANEVSIAGGSVAIGGTAASPAVLGDLLLAEFLLHTHPTAVGPTGPPTKPIPPTVLSTSVKVQK
jgi:hypothetical protein